MGYVSNNLLSDEQIIYSGKITNYIFLPGIVSLIIAFSIFFISLSGDMQGEEELSSYAPFVFFVFFIYGAGQIISKLFYKFSTELAVTNKRIIVKTGFIKRNTIELNHNRIESISVDQSVLGRILNYGDVFIRGTGGVLTPVKAIDNPISFRNESMKVVDKS